MGSQGMRAQAKLPASLQNPTLSRRDLSALLPATDPRPALTVSRGPMGHWFWVPRSKCSSDVIPEDSGVGVRGMVLPEGDSRGRQSGALEERAIHAGTDSVLTPPLM